MPLPFITKIPPLWRGALIRLVLVWAGLVVLLHRDWAAMADQWWNSSTYTHMLLVPPILVWLVAQRAGALAKLRPCAWWPALGGMALALALWVAGRLAGLMEASEAGAVALLMTSAAALLGPRVTAGLAFPLFYMVFLVPVGDEFVPPLQTLTARLTIALIHLSHVRATIDGVFITTPAGLFVIAEACSGVKFLAAMVAFGVLAANVCFVRWPRRLAFLAACVAVPVLANGVRAWGTIYVAQFMGAAYAGGFDHIVYGWIFFAIVMVVLLAASWRFFDRPAAAPMIDAGPLLASPRLARWGRWTMPPVLALVLMAGMMLGGMAWVRAGEALVAPVPARIALPDVPGWHRVAPESAPHPWRPRAAGAAQRLLGRYADDAGHEVDVFFALYAAQRGAHKAGGYGEGAMPAGFGWAWQAPGPPVADALSQWLRAKDDGSVTRLAETSYATGGLVTGSTLRLRLANLRDRLLLRRRVTMMLILSAENAPGRSAAPAIAVFRHAVGPLEGWMGGIVK